MSTSRLCPSCGNQNEEGVRFCTACGTELPKPEPSSSTTASAGKPAAPSPKLVPPPQGSKPKGVAPTEKLPVVEARPEPPEDVAAQSEKPPAADASSAAESSSAATGSSATEATPSAATMPAVSWVAGQYARVRTWWLGLQIQWKAAVIAGLVLVVTGAVIGGVLGSGGGESEAPLVVTGDTTTTSMVEDTTTTTGEELVWGGIYWKFEVGGKVSSALVADGVLYFGCDDGYFYAVDAKTGQGKWRFETDRFIENAPFLWSGTVFIDGGDFGRDYDVDAETGQEVPSRPGKFLGGSDGSFAFLGSGKSPDGLVAYDANTGEPLWEWLHMPDHFIGGEPVWVGGRRPALWTVWDQSRVPVIAKWTLYCCNDDGIYAIDLSNGDVKWNVRPGMPEAVRFVSGGVVLVEINRDSREYWYGLNRTNGRTKWKIESDADLVDFAVSDEAFYGSFGAISLKTGEQLQVVDGDEYPYDGFTRPVIFKDTLYCTDGGVLWALDVDTFDVLWRMVSASGRAVAASKGVVYVVDGSYVYAVGRGAPESPVIIDGSSTPLAPETTTTTAPVTTTTTAPAITTTTAPATTTTTE